jgi:hypothetical protein
MEFGFYKGFDSRFEFFNILVDYIHIALDNLFEAPVKSITYWS